MREDGREREREREREQNIERNKIGCSRIGVREIK
jgi:hypothetical protein